MPADRPNLIVFTSHDLGTHLPCYGVDTVDTPNIDRLAAEGVVFGNHFATAPTCSPSRGGMWTGRYPHTVGMLGLASPGPAWLLHDHELHLAQRLRAVGYQTALFGDQHSDFRGSARLGFDREDPGKRELNPPAERSAAMFVDFLRQVDTSDRPFFAQMGTHEPHRPFDHNGTEPDRTRGVAVPELYPDTDAYRDEFAGYQGCIKRLDRGVGMVLDALEETGLAENTVVVFTVDHGSPFPRAKMNLYDPGLRIALIVRAPQWSAPAGRRVQAMTSNVDLVPTLLEGLGMDVPENLHGCSLMPLLRGDTETGRSRVFGTQTYHGTSLYLPMRAVRTARYKYIVNFEKMTTLHSSWQPLVQELAAHRPELAGGYRPTYELYDVQEDPLELENLSGRQEFEGIEAQLDAELRAWMGETEDPLLRGIPPSPAYCRARQPRHLVSR